MKKLADIATADTTGERGMGEYTGPSPLPDTRRTEMASVKRKVNLCPSQE